MTLAFVDLEPGMYTLYYRTDGSHSFEDWSNGEPAHGERWGISLFSLNGDSNNFQIGPELRAVHFSSAFIE